MAPAPPAREPRSENLAAIDVGTNSVHVVVARVRAGDDGPRFDVLEQEKDMVRLGSSGGDMKHLEPRAVDRAIDALARFRRLAEAHDATIAAVATSAVREAENRAELIDRAWTEAGVHVDVISGAEEARLIHLGALQDVPVYDRRLLLCDIGGGSTELVVGDRGEACFTRSLKLGAIRLTRRFFGGSKDHPGAVDACRRHIRTTLAPVGRGVLDLAPEVMVGSSGTVAALATAAAVAETGVAPRTVSNAVLRRGALDGVVAALVEAGSDAARAEIPGIESKRADIILAGALILQVVMHDLDMEELRVSAYALREGVLLDRWQRRHGGTLHHLSQLRRRSVLDLVEAMDEDPAHSRHVAALALQLFDGLRERLGLGDEDGEVLEAAAALSNVGTYISHAQHHRHSYYVIRHAERLAGFHEGELELIALVARYHRKSAPKDKHPEFAALDERDRWRVRCLAGIVRVAIGLDRSHAAKVERVTADVADAGVRVVAVPAPGADVTLELFAAEARKALLEEVTGLPVTLTVR